MLTALSQLAEKLLKTSGGLLTDCRLLCSRAVVGNTVLGVGLFFLGKYHFAFLPCRTHHMVSEKIKCTDFITILILKTYLFHFAVIHYNLPIFADCLPTQGNANAFYGTWLF